MRTVARWAVKVPSDEGRETAVTSLCFNPNGTEVVVSAGDKVFIYSASSGNLLQILKGHKDTVYCVAYASDGQRFASGGADRTVIVWSYNGDGILKYQHQESVLSLSYNPITQQLASTSVTDFGIWGPNQKSVNKVKIPSRAPSCAWSIDGQHLAIGMFDGTISICDQMGVEERVLHRRAPIWCLAFSPSPWRATSSLDCITEEDNEETDTGDEPTTDRLAVGAFDQTLSFYNTSNGQQMGVDIQLGYDPTCLSYFGRGSYILITGSNKKCCMYTKEGNFLSCIAESRDWVWAVQQRARNLFIVVASNDCVVSGIEMNNTTVHSIYKEFYIYRSNITDVIIQNLELDKMIVLHTNDYVRKVSVYKGIAAVQLSDRILVYGMSVENDTKELSLRLKHKIMKKLECSLMCIVSTKIILCQDNRLTLCDFSGNKQREWVLEAPVRYIKIVSGPVDRESLLVGLKDGHVLRVFVDNSLPTVLAKLNNAIRCVDISIYRKILAVVDESNMLRVLLLHANGANDLLFTEDNVSAVAWNTEYEDMLCYTGAGKLSVRTGSLAPFSQELQGFVVGFKGSKVFSLHAATMHTTEIPQSYALSQYIALNDFKSAYRIACMGVASEDWRRLGIAAMTRLELDIARRAFTHIKDVALEEMLRNTEMAVATGAIMSGENSTAELLVEAELFANQGQFADAAARYIAANERERAVEMYCDMCMWDEARSLCEGSKELTKLVLQRQAQWAETIGEYSEATALSLSAGDHRSAVKLLGARGDVERLLEVAREIPSSDVEALRECAEVFKRFRCFKYATECFERAGDTKGLLQTGIEQEQWGVVFAQLQRNPEYKQMVYMPWAQWLATHDRFKEACDAFREAGRPDEAILITKKLASCSLTMRKYAETAFYYLHLACEVGRGRVQSSKVSSGEVTSDNTSSNNNNSSSCAGIPAEANKKGFIDTCTTRPTSDCLSNNYNNNNTSGDKADNKSFKSHNTCLNTQWEYHTGAGSDKLISFTYRFHAELYYAYNYVYRYLYEPYAQLDTVVVLNVSRYLIGVLTPGSGPAEGPAFSPPLPQELKRGYIYVALARSAHELGMYRLARTAVDRLSGFVLSCEMQDAADLLALELAALPTTNSSAYTETCFRCGQTLTSLSAAGDRCPACLHRFVRSFASFKALPLIEFVPDPALTDAEAERILLSGRVGAELSALHTAAEKHSAQAAIKSTGGEANEGAADMLKIEQHVADKNDTFDDSFLEDASRADPFAAQRLTFGLETKSKNILSLSGAGGASGGWSRKPVGESGGGEGRVYVPFICSRSGLSSLRPGEVFIVKSVQHNDTNKINNLYYWWVDTSVDVTMCTNCQHFFETANYEYSLCAGKGCPFCKNNSILEERMQGSQLLS